MPCLTLSHRRDTVTSKHCKVISHHMAYRLNRLKFSKCSRMSKSYLSNRSDRNTNRVASPLKTAWPFKHKSSKVSPTHSTWTPTLNLCRTQGSSKTCPTLRVPTTWQRLQPIVPRGLLTLLITMSSSHQLPRALQDSLSISTKVTTRTFWRNQKMTTDSSAHSIEILHPQIFKI